MRYRQVEVESARADHSVQALVSELVQQQLVLPD
jgi:hypothetical protein